MAHRTDANATLLGRMHRAFIPVEDFANFLAAFAIINNPISGYIDLVELSMASMAFLGASYCQRLGSHVRMELLIGRLKGRSLWAFEALGAALAMFIIGVLIYYSYGHFLRSYTLGDTTMDAEFPVWPSKLLVPVAFSIWFIRLGLQLVGSLRMLINPDATPVAVVVAKDVAEQAQDEIDEIMGDGANLSDPEGRA